MLSVASLSIERFICKEGLIVYMCVCVSVCV